MQILHSINMFRWIRTTSEMQKKQKKTWMSRVKEQITEKDMADLHADSRQLAALTDGVSVGPEEGVVLHILAVSWEKEKLTFAIKSQKKGLGDPEYFQPYDNIWHTSQNVCIYNHMLFQTHMIFFLPWNEKMQTSEEHPGQSTILCNEREWGLGMSSSKKTKHHTRIIKV